MSKKSAYALIIVAVTVTFILFFKFAPNSSVAVSTIEQEKTKIVKDLTTNTTGETKKKSTDSTKKTKEMKQSNKTFPDVKTSDWNLLLVNEKHAIKNDQIALKTIEASYQVDERIYDDYMRMKQDADKAGITLQVVSAYRSVAYQKELFQNDVDQYLAQGMDQKTAEKKTREYMTRPGYSEHHTGLALDITDHNEIEKGLVAELQSAPAIQWLSKNAMKYGFVLRYPKDKESITEIKFEPWHYRYVGKENAKYMVKYNLALEEYIELLKKAGK